MNCIFMLLFSLRFLNTEFECMKIIFLVFQQDGWIFFFFCMALEAIKSQRSSI